MSTIQRTLHDNGTLKSETEIENGRIISVSTYDDDGQAKEAVNICEEKVVSATQFKNEKQISTGKGDEGKKNFDVILSEKSCRISRIDNSVEGAL